MTWAAVGAAAVTAVGSVAGAAMSKGSGGGLQYEQLPGYEESDKARGDIADRLDEWGGDPNYGAISPAWEDIWSSARKKVGRYYWGGPGETGVAGKVKAGAARRGTSDSPAIDTLMTRLGQQEGQQLGDMASEQAIAKAAFGETGRQNWMQSMFGLAKMKPDFVTSTGVSNSNDTGQAVSELGGSLGGLIAGMNFGGKKYDDPVGTYNVGFGQGSYPGGYAPTIGKS